MLYSSDVLDVFSFQAIMMKITNYKQYNKRITSHNNGVQSHDQEESKFNSTLKYD